MTQIKYSGNLTREKIFLYSFKSSCTKKRNKDEACFKQSESQFKKFHWKFRQWSSGNRGGEKLWTVFLVSDHPKKIGNSDAFYVTIRHVFDYTFLTKNIKECSLQIYSIAQCTWS